MIKKLLSVIFLFFTVSLLFANDLFWEAPELFNSRAGTFPVSAHSEAFSVVAWQEVTPNGNGSAVGGGTINVNVAIKEVDGQWIHRGTVGGPYRFLGSEPSILSIAVDNQNRIIIAAAAGDAQTEILISSDRGRSFRKQTINLGAENSVAPRIYVRADGGFLLFVTRGRAESLTIYYSRSYDGFTWSSFQPFVTESALTLNFLPAHASVEIPIIPRDEETVGYSIYRDVVFFQSRIMGAEELPAFQLFYKISDDGGITWTESRRFTTFNDPIMETQAAPNSFDNQRPHLSRYGDNFFLVWERRFSTQSPHIYSVMINSSGNRISAIERINEMEAFCQNPISFIYNNTPRVVWFDNRNGNNRIYLAQRDFLSWTNTALSSAAAESSFARPIVCYDGAYIFWQTTVRDSNRIYVLSPDTTCQSPFITALNFAPSQANRAERVRVSWNIPSDTSGIAGFSWAWSQDIDEMPPQEIMVFNTGNIQDRTLEHHANTDGEWYFTVRALDYAGNWSDPGRVLYYRKGYPPGEVTIIEPELDDRGFLLSSSFEMQWEPSDDPYVAGYTWTLQFLGANENTSIFSPPQNIMGTETSASYVNQDNGIWAFTVAAIDQAGNIGPPSSLIIRNNKFIPYTSVSYIDAHQDEQGVLSVRIVGRGFASGGRVTSVVLQQEGQPDVYIENFNIVSDREITFISEDTDEGRYRIRLEHSVRGWYIADSFIPVARTGTVKFGDYSSQWRPSWLLRPGALLTVNPITVLALLLIIFCVLGIIAAIRGIGNVITESAAIKQEAQAIITGDFMPTEKKQRIVRIYKRGRGLRFKLASFTIGLVLLVIIMISTPMYILMTNTQQETLLKSLWDRSNVLLEGISSGVRAHMPRAISSGGDEGVLDLMFLPAQSAAIPEAKYITITGYGINSIHTDHVWASNDPNIESKIDTIELRLGVSRYNDEHKDYFDEVSAEYNSIAQQQAGEIAGSIRDMFAEGIALMDRFDDEADRLRHDIQVTINDRQMRLNEILSGISKDMGSYPEFSLDSISSDGNRTYIFYKPVLFRSGADNNFFRGLIRLEVSTDIIIDAINYGQGILLRTIGIVALIVLLIGVTGAFIFSTVIIIPIRKLVKHIEVIRDTEDKTKLSGTEITIKTKDEIAILGNTINDMTAGLVKAALAASDLSIGKEIQKKFIPLEVDNQGNKQSYGFKHTPNLNFFGYYEGAKGVSGDYFDYKDLDGRYYAMIKCDVAGKGIPAALIMIQVATMFLNYFKQWKPNAKGMRIEEVVYQINDFIETLAFKGRFAAFTLCLFDSQTGVVRFCNAGDNVVHYYDASEEKLKAVTLPQTPATGVLPNFMIETTGGYNVQTLQIDKGDILLLYTDGIEEGKRKFRDRSFKEIICTEGPVDTPHANHLCGQADEEMGPDRVEAIINAVMARTTYTLHKYHNPEESQEGQSDLQFDFSTCEGRVEDVIMALIAVEKMFRCYKPADAGEDSRVLIEKKVDEFLKNHFLQYRRYCSHTSEFLENPAYMYYTHIKEDEQYDDLTILGIKRK
ncbi:MAG: SpoIIE family protein phosphatase [Treponema sp.]|nr:SpoIIE family protein phosphatase [Treponema sp.]